MSKKLTRWQRFKAFLANDSTHTCCVCGDEFSHPFSWPALYYATVRYGLIEKDWVCTKQECLDAASKRELEVGGFTGAHVTAFGQGWLQAASGQTNTTPLQRYTGFTSGKPPGPSSNLF